MQYAQGFSKFEESEEGVVRKGGGEGKEGKERGGRKGKGGG